MEEECSEYSMHACAHTCTHAHDVKLICQIHTGDHEKAATRPSPRASRPGHTSANTHTEKRTGWGWGAAGRGASRPGCRDGGSVGSELLFTAQSPSVVIATQPPNRETDITASRGGRKGGG